MAKKMQRLDESPDFRPFKFRIQAFTNAFLEEVRWVFVCDVQLALSIPLACASGLPRGENPNEKGASSQTLFVLLTELTFELTRYATFCGTNHTSLGSMRMARSRSRRVTTSGTLMRRRPMVAGCSVLSSGDLQARRLAWPMSVCDGLGLHASGIRKHRGPICSLIIALRRCRHGYLGKMRYCREYPPRMLRTAMSRSRLELVNFDSFFSFCLTTHHQFVQEGKEEFLSHTVRVTIAPMASVDSTFTPSRRPSLVGDIQNPRRVMSDTVVAQSNPPRSVATLPSLVLP